MYSKIIIFEGGGVVPKGNGVYTSEFFDNIIINPIVWEFKI